MKKKRTDAEWKQLRAEFTASHPTYEGRISTAADVDEALTTIEQWRDDPKAGHDWGSCYVQYDVMSPLMKALAADPALITAEVWKRLKALSQHPEDAVNWTADNHLRELTKLDRQYAVDVKNILIDMAKTHKDEYYRDHAIHLLFQVVTDSKEPAMVEEALTVFSEALNDPAARVRVIAADAIDGLARFHGVDSFRAMTLVAPLLKDSDRYVRMRTGSNLQYALRGSLSKIAPEKAENLRAIFKTQADGAAGWRGKSVRQTVSDVLDTYDFTSALVNAARDNTDSQAQDKAKEFLDMVEDNFFLNLKDNAKAVEYLAPFLQDKRPAVQGWAAYLAKDRARSERLDVNEVPRLRAIFKAQADAAHFWERTVKRSNREVIEALDKRAQRSPS